MYLNLPSVDGRIDGINTTPAPRDKEIPSCLYPTPPVAMPSPRTSLTSSLTEPVCICWSTKTEANTGVSTTLLQHKTLWVDESAQHPATELTLLTEQEQQLYRDLKQQRWGQNVRLEQERIDWATAWSVLQRALA